MSKRPIGEIRQTRRQLLQKTAAFGALAFGVQIAGVESAVAAPAAQALPRNQTLNIGGFQWGPPTTYNPINSNPTWPSTGSPQLIYQSLFGYNLVDGKLHPMLAKSVASPDPNTMVVTMQDGAKWQDGQPVTVDDVVYTYTLPQRVQGLSYSTLFDYITKVEAPDAKTIKLSLNAEKLNPGMVRNYLSTIYILPKHIWEAREKDPKGITNVVDNAPVGSGPYKIQASSPERVALQRDDNYWGNTAIGKPAPQYIVHPIFKSNDDGNLALQRGEVDWSQQFVPQIWKMWENQKLPVGTWLNKEPYYVPGSIPLLFINVQKKPLDNPKVREALAYAINYPQIAATAMSRYSAPANASLIIPSGGESQFFEADKVKADGWSYNADKAKQILEQDLKATKKDGVYVLPDGTKLGSWTAQCPYGWTDWMTALQLVSQNAKSAGIDISTNFPEAPIVTTNMQTGNFDFALWYVTGASPAAPWARFRDVMDNRGVPKIGEKAFWNYNRYSNPKVPDLLDKAAAASEADQKALFAQLDEIYRQDIPVIPLMYRPDEFYEFNESTWTGFPTDANPNGGAPMFKGAGVFNLNALKPKAG